MSSPSRATRCPRAAPRSPARGCETLPLLESNSFLPDLDDVDDWDRIALFWVNYPNNPTGATAPLAFYERLGRLAREHDFVLCSDEAYSELWFDEPPRSALELGDRSQRRRLPDALEALVDDRVSLRLRRRLPRDRLRAQDISALDGRGAAGVRPARIGGRLERRGARRADAGGVPPQARRSPPGARAQGLARRRGRRDHVPLGRGAGRRDFRGLRGTTAPPGVVVAPGSYLGDSGEGYIRIALVPTLAECERAAAILEDVL